MFACVRHVSLVVFLFFAWLVGTLVVCCFVVCALVLFGCVVLA